jgi:hypothetical protein
MTVEHVLNLNLKLAVTVKWTATTVFFAAFVALVVLGQVQVGAEPAAGEPRVTSSWNLDSEWTSLSSLTDSDTSTPVPQFEHSTNKANGQHQLGSGSQVSRSGRMETSASWGMPSSKSMSEPEGRVLRVSITNCADGHDS